MLTSFLLYRAIQICNRPSRNANTGLSNTLTISLTPNSLPHVLVTLQRHARAKGYFAPERFAGRVEKVTAHELAMNPDVFTGRSDELILSTLVHEMAHVWQQSQGTPPRRSYHDKEWAAKMCEIGLQPSTTGEPGGKETGQSVTHYIVPGGPFVRAYAKLRATGFQLNWQSVPLDGGERKKKVGQQDEIHVPHVRNERLGKASNEVDLRRVLRRGRRRNHHP